MTPVNEIRHHDIIGDGLKRWQRADYFDPPAKNAWNIRAFASFSLSMTPTHRKLTPQQLRPILAESKTIAVVGISPNPERASHSVAAYLQAQGYRIVPVNPKITMVLGEKACATCGEARRALPLNSGDFPTLSETMDAPGVLSMPAGKLLPGRRPRCGDRK